MVASTHSWRWRGPRDRRLAQLGWGTLIADTTKGNRPSFTAAEAPEHAEPIVETFCEALRGLGVPVQTGVFGARMEVELANDVPVTIVLES